jgi:hypothetical protein
MKPALATHSSALVRDQNDLTGQAGRSADSSAAMEESDEGEVEERQGIGPVSVAGSLRESPLHGRRMEFSAPPLDRSSARGLDGLCRATYGGCETPSAIAISSQPLPMVWRTTLPSIDRYGS